MPQQGSTEVRVAVWHITIFILGCSKAPEEHSQKIRVKQFSGARISFVGAAAVAVPLVWHCRVGRGRHAIGAFVTMRVETKYPQGKRWWARLRRLPSRGPLAAELVREPGKAAKKRE
jgi:hypothetical protein